MDTVICNILDALRDADELSPAQLDRIIRARSAQVHDGRRIFAKKRILPYYLSARAQGDVRWRSWGVDEDLDERFVKALQMKPRRTASGVATITVITKPWPCSNSCVYCPNDESMPKSYLSDEPACQRAERNLFHPYLQVASRLRTLEQMGHATGKVELIVLGGTWLDYPRDYRTWFIAQLFAALNDTPEARQAALSDPEPFAATERPPCTKSSLRALHERNETADHRVVGLVVETRPDTITAQSLFELRELGCTKIQLGVQAVRDEVLAANGRSETAESIRAAFGLCRLFGFKIHAHFMINLLGASPLTDVEDYRLFTHDAGFQPDEVKLYPCALVAGTELVSCYEHGAWRPYDEEELLDVLATNLLDTPAFMRVSRMIRDISAQDILVGNKKTNLRQLVEERVACQGTCVREIRYREIGTDDVDLTSLAIEEVRYETNTTSERFLQWVTPEGGIAGFLRLSLPKAGALENTADPLPIGTHDAMIREVHVYGFATQVAKQGASAQHHGLGRALVERACEIATREGYRRLLVISAVGTRPYYRKLGFADEGLYQMRVLPKGVARCARSF